MHPSTSSSSIIPPSVSDASAAPPPPRPPSQQPQQSQHAQQSRPSDNAPATTSAAPSPANAASSSTPHNSPRERTPPPETRNASLATAVARLKQQDLKSYTVTFSPRCVISIYFTIAIIFIPLGASILASTARIASTEGLIEYGSVCTNASLVGPTKPCSVTFNLSRDIGKPSYLYYALSNYHQNARDYVKSRSDIQNQGRVPKAHIDYANCERALCPDGEDRCTEKAAEEGVNPGERIVYPCGLTARSFFNDVFELCRDEQCDDKIPLQKEGIAWGTDTKYKFRKGEAQPFEVQREWPFLRDGETRSANELLEDDDFVVWMRLAAFPSFTKLYRIIDEPLSKGKYFMRINNTFDVEPFEGRKYFFISTMAWFGGRNPFLGSAYVVVGTCALFVAVVLLLKHVVNPSAPNNIDPAVLLREHLAKLSTENATDAMHQHQL